VIYRLCLLLLIATLQACVPTDKPLDPPRASVDDLIPPTGLLAFDAPGDGGNAIVLSWNVSPTENTPDFLIRIEIKRRLNETERPEKEIHKEVWDEYSKEPKIEYRIYSPDMHNGLMSLQAALYNQDRNGAILAWEEYFNEFEKASTKKRLDMILSLSKFGEDISGQESVKQFKERVLPFENQSDIKDTPKRLEYLYALLKEAPCSIDQLSTKIRSLSSELTLLAASKGDLSGMKSYVETLEDSGPISHKEFLLENAISLMGSKRIRGYSTQLMVRLVKENRVLLNSEESGFIDSQIALSNKETAKMEKRVSLLRNETKALLEKTLDTPARAGILWNNLKKNRSWRILASFRSGINFERKGDTSCDFEERGGDRHYYKVKDLINDFPYTFRVDLVMGGKTVHLKTDEGQRSVSAVSRINWFKKGMFNLLICIIILIFEIVFFIQRARVNPNLFIRRIRGIDAVDNAVNHAAKMGKSVYYMVGSGAISELPTIASMSILERIAKRAAKMNTRIKVPCFNPMVMTVAQDVVKDAYLSEGADYHSEDVFFVTSDQFSYAASVDGMLLRDKPAANFFMGSFQSESLLLSEVGSNIGAIQVSGTNEASQLPFFITTTDYTLIGEEFFAASAYLTRNPLLLGSLKGQDVGKAVLIVVITGGALLSAFGKDWIWSFFQ